MAADGGERRQCHGRYGLVAGGRHWSAVDGKQTERFEVVFGSRLVIAPVASHSSDQVVDGLP